MKLRKWINKIMTGVLVGMVAFISLPSISTQAAQKTYTVTYRPGNTGYFAVSNTTKTDKKDMAVEVAQALYGNVSSISKIEVTDNGAIKLTVNKDAIVPTAPSTSYIGVNAGYFAKSASEWGPSSTDKVVKNIDFTVDYGKLVNGVEYTIRYLDAASNTSIAPITIGYANIGDTITVTAPTNITISESTDYNISIAAVQTLVLNADKDQNVVTYTYAVVPGGTNVTEIINYVDGDTIVTETTTTTIVEGETPLAPGADVAAGQITDTTDDVVIPDAETPLVEEVENETEDGTTSDRVTIEDDETPLNDSIEPDSDTVIIEDETVALSGKINTTYMIYIMAGVLAAALLAVFVVWFRVKNKQNSTGDDK